VVVLEKRLINVCVSVSLPLCWYCLHKERDALSVVAIEAMYHGGCHSVSVEHQSYGYLPGCKASPVWLMKYCVNIEVLAKPRMTHHQQHHLCLFFFRRTCVSQSNLAFQPRFSGRETWGISTLGFFSGHANSLCSKHAEGVCPAWEIPKMLIPKVIFQKKVHGTWLGKNFASSLVVYYLHKDCHR